jgi:hypothetical protein
LCFTGNAQATIIARYDYSAWGVEGPAAFGIFSTAISGDGPACAHDSDIQFLGIVIQETGAATETANGQAQQSGQDSD